MPCVVGRVDLAGLVVAAEAFSLAAEPGESVAVVYSNVSVFQDSGQAKLVFQRLTGAHTSCAADAAEALGEAGPLEGLVGVSVVESVEFPALGEESAAWRIEIQLGNPEPGGPDWAVNVTTDVVHVRAGPVYLLLAFAGVPGPVR